MLLSVDAGVAKRQCRTERCRVKESPYPVGNGPQILVWELLESKIPGALEGCLSRHQAGRWEKFCSREQNGIRVPVADKDAAAARRGFQRDDTAAAKRVDY